MKKQMQTMIGIATLLFAVITGCRTNVVENGKSAAEIVLPSSPTQYEKFAAEELQNFLQQSTSVKFRICKVNEKQTDGPKIHLGKRPCLPVLERGKYMIKASGDDIYLYGGGLRGTLSAVYRFLNDEVGIRFLNAYGDVYVPRKQTIGFRGEKFYSEGLPYRALMTYFHTNQPTADPFYFRNGQNILLGSSKYGWINEAVGLGRGNHSIQKFLPPSKYFKSHPEYYTMDRNGKRTKDQVCFSAPGVRKEFTRNVIAFCKPRHRKYMSEGKIAWIEISAMDSPGRFCECPECKKAAEKYQTPCGAFMEFLCELATAIQKDMPNTYIATLLYRKDQMETPPIGLKFPKNVAGIFAPIDDNIFAPMDQTHNRETLENLKTWCKLLSQVWVWYYPDTYGTGTMPYSAVRRSIRDYKLMKEAGITGTYYEHDVSVVNSFNFGELTSYVLLKLFSESDQSSDALITEFLNLYYGKAAPMVEKYLNELEDFREAGVKKGVVGFYAASPFVLGYLTPENLERWATDFDAMEKAVKDDLKSLFHVQLLRFTVDKTRLDFMTCPQKDRKAIAEKLTATLDRISKDRRLYKSVNKRNYDELKSAIKSTNSATEIEVFGSGSHTEKTAFPYHLNCYDYRTVETPEGIRAKNRWTLIDCVEYSKGIKSMGPLCPKWTLLRRRILQAKDVKPDVFAWYEIGTLPLTNAARICTTDYDYFFKDVGRFYRNPDDLWKISIKLKFEGPFVPGSKAKVSKVHCGGFRLEKIK